MEAAAAAVQVEEVERRTSYLELFFDLVFVFAITQVTTLMLDDPSVAGYAKGTLVLATIYWAWSAYTWATNAIDLGEPLHRIGFLLAMGASFGMAIGVTDAFSGSAEWFAVPFFFVRMLHLALYIHGLRDEPAHQAAVLKLTPWFAVAPLLVLVGGFVEHDARIALWTAAIVIDVTGALRMGPQTGFRVSPSHFAERYALFIIIALGESIVAIGVGLAGHTRNAAFAAALAVAFAGVAALWWAYFDFTATVLERALARRPAEVRGPVARDVFTLCHFPMVLGIILFAVAAKKTVGAPGDPLSGAGRFALGAGIALFLVGFGLGRYRMIRHVAYERLAAAAAAIVAVIVFSDVDGLALMAIVVGALVAGLAWETVHLRTFRAEVRAGSTQS
jgi:low temperature requirement protein LtrA